MNMETDIIREIKSISLDSNHRFSFIAKYIINNISLISEISIKELASLTYSSVSTINRFTKYLNLSGYKELIHIIKYFNYALIENDQEVGKKTTCNIIHETYEDINKSIKETFSLFLTQDKVIAKVIKKMKSVKKINIFAVGGTYNLANDFHEKLLRIGFNAIAINNFHDGFFLSKQSDKDIFNIFISYSGETQDLIKLALICKENKSEVLTISNKDNNTLTKIGDFKLVVSSTESIVRTVSIVSRLTLMFFLDMIFNKILLTNFDYYQSILKSTSLKKV